MTRLSWAQPRFLFFLCGSCSSLDARITLSVHCCVTPTLPFGTEASAMRSGTLSVPGARDLSSNSQRWLIYHTIVANSLFVTFDRSMSRIKSLRESNSALARSAQGTKDALNRLALSFARDFFFWFPVAASAIVFYLDRRSYFQPDPFEPESLPPGTEAPFFIVSTAVFVACWIPLMLCSLGSARNSRATDARRAGVRRETPDPICCDESRIQTLSPGDSPSSRLLARSEEGPTVMAIQHSALQPSVACITEIDISRAARALAVLRCERLRPGDRVWFLGYRDVAVTGPRSHQRSVGRPRCPCVDGLGSRVCRIYGLAARRRDRSERLALVLVGLPVHGRSCRLARAYDGRDRDVAGRHVLSER